MLTQIVKSQIVKHFTPGHSNVVADCLSCVQTVAFKELSLEKLEQYVDRMSFPI